MNKICNCKIIRGSTGHLDFFEFLVPKYPTARSFSVSNVILLFNMAEQRLRDHIQINVIETSLPRDRATDFWPQELI